MWEGEHEKLFRKLDASKVGAGEDVHSDGYHVPSTAERGHTCPAQP